MIFNTQINGTDCKCKVTTYSESEPMQITGSGFGDAEPPMPGEFEFRILDANGEIADELESEVTESDEERLLDEYLSQRDRT